MKRGARRLVVGAGPADGRVYVAQAGEGGKLRLTQAVREARQFADPAEAGRLVASLMADPDSGGERRWRVFDLARVAGAGIAPPDQSGSAAEDKAEYAASAGDNPTMRDVVEQSGHDGHRGAAAGGGHLDGADAHGQSLEDIGRGGD